MIQTYKVAVQPISKALAYVHLIASALREPAAIFLRDSILTLIENHAEEIGINDAAETVLGLPNTWKSKVLSASLYLYHHLRDSQAFCSLGVRYTGRALEICMLGDQSLKSLFNGVLEGDLKLASSQAVGNDQYAAYVRSCFRFAIIDEEFLATDIATVTGQLAEGGPNYVKGQNFRKNCEILNQKLPKP
jgi:hypothetical protein